MEVFEEKSDKIKFIFQSRALAVVWRMSCAEKRSAKRPITRKLLESFRKEMTNLSFLRVFVFAFLTSNILYVYVYN